MTTNTNRVNTIRIMTITICIYVYYIIILLVNVIKAGPAYHINRAALVPFLKRRERSLF